MAETQIFKERLPGGLTLLAEPLAGVRSWSMSLWVPAGLATQPTGKVGVANVLAEQVNRGAGGLSAREHSEALDALGVHRTVSASPSMLSLGATLLSDHWESALPLLLDTLLSPTLDDTSFEPARDLALQDLAGLADDPQQQATTALRQRHLPGPFNHHPLGEQADLQALTAQDVRTFWSQRVRPSGAVLAVAGDVNALKLRDRVSALIEHWRGEAPSPTMQAMPARSSHHVYADSAQVHIALAYDSVAEPDERSVLQRCAAAVLSGGMSGRLFTEVREKRGLCYSVYAGYEGRREFGNMIAYSGTTTPRAQETLDVLRGELVRLSDGVTQAEFDRAKVGMKARLVMQGESSSARASAIALDELTIGRPRTLQERAEKVDAVTLETLNAYVADHRPGAMTLVTVGPEALRA